MYSFAMTWDEIVQEIKEKSQEMHGAREVGLTKCRSLIQHSAKAIRHIHRHQFEEAEKLLAEARQIADDTRAALREHGELYYAGYLHDAEKELVEAHATYAIVRGRDWPTPSELGCGVMAYLNGMGEAASEVRRFALDEMRRGSTTEAENILIAMETIYDDLITFDFADSMMGGLRRTCDALRAVIERTRSDLTMSATQRALVVELQATRDALK
jgi:translin